MNPIFEFAIDELLDDFLDNEDPEEEEAALHLLNNIIQKSLRYQKLSIFNSVPRFDLNCYTDEECRLLFRFTKEQIVHLRIALGIADIVHAPNRSKASGIEALCILLRRFAYPNRLFDLRAVFGRQTSELSHFFTLILDHVFFNFGHLLNYDATRLTTAKLQEFSGLIHQKGAPLPRCWGFIDGTVRAICRPTYNQKQVFNGHKRVHSLKFQSVTTPDGIIVHMSGPWLGRRHDCRMLRESGLPENLQQYAKDADNNPFYLYGDPAYPLSPYLLAPYKGIALTAQQREFNKAMSSVRETVEWGFAKIIALWAFLDYRKNLKLYLQPVGKFYLVGCILTNCHTCMNGSQTADFFSSATPTLEDYLGLAHVI